MTRELTPEELGAFIEYADDLKDVLEGDIEEAPESDFIKEDGTFKENSNE